MIVTILRAVNARFGQKKQKRLGMNSLLPFYSVNNLLFSGALFISSIIACIAVNRIVKVSPIGKHNDLSLEALRGFACILVFINHSYSVISAIGIKNKVIDIAPNIVYDKMGSIGVALFFCLTGFLFSSKIKNENIDIIFFKKRIYRLFPAYLATSIIVFMIFIYQRWEYVNDVNSIITIIQRVFGFGFWGGGIKVNDIWDHSLNIVIWTLPYEWKFYAVIPFIACIYSIKPFRYIVIPFIFIVMYIDFNSSTVLWVYFITGFIASYIKNTPKKFETLILYIAMPLSLAYYIYGDFKAYGWGMYILLSVFFFMFIRGRTDKLAIIGLSNIGIISYSLYLIHQPVLNLTFNFYSNIFDISLIENRAFTILCIISLLLSILVSSFLYNKVEKKFQLK